MLPNPIYFGHYDSNKANKGRTEHDDTTRMTLIEMFLEDSGSVSINGETYKIKKGNILFTRIGEKRHYVYPFKTKFVYFRDISPELQSMLDSFPSYFQLDMYEDISPLFDKVFDFLTSDMECADVFASSALMELLCKVKWVHIQQYNSLMRSKNTSPISKAMYYMNQHYFEPITVEQIAAACGLSVSYLHKRFLQLVKMTPVAYLNRVRISAAKRLLSSTDDSTDVIAQKCGFASQTYFTTAFKKAVKTTPQKYRKSIRYPM